jgi:hypothetical protein
MTHLKTEKQAEARLKPTGNGIKQKIHNLYDKARQNQYKNQYLYIFSSFLLFLVIKSLSGLRMNQMINTLIAVPKDQKEYIIAAFFAIIVNMVIIYLLSVFLLCFFITHLKLEIEFIEGKERFLYAIGSCFVHATAYVAVIYCNLHLSTWGKELSVFFECTFGRIIVQIYRMVFDMVNVIIPSSGLSHAITIFFFIGMIGVFCEKMFNHFLKMIIDVDLFNLICPFLPIFIIFTSLQIFNNQHNMNQLIIKLLVFPIILGTICLTYIISDWRGWQQFYLDLSLMEEIKKKNLRLTVNKTMIENKRHIIFAAVSFTIYFFTELITKIDSRYYVDSLLNFNSIYDAKNVLNHIELSKTSTSNITLILAISTVISLIYDFMVASINDNEKEYILITEKLLVVLASNNVYLTIQLWLTFFDSKKAISMSGIVKVVKSIVYSIGKAIDSLSMVIEKAGTVVEVIFTIVVLVLIVVFFILLVKLAYTLIGSMLILVLIKYVPFLLLYTIIAYISQKYLVNNLSMKYLLYGATFIASYLISDLQQKFMQIIMSEDDEI